MRKLYNEFFYIPKHGKVREKVMLARLTSTITIVIMCLAAMSITAYAYFSYNITSGSNIIKAANFETNVLIQITDKNNEAVVLNRADRGTQTATLYKDNTYSVTIEKAGSAQTGFCVITASDCEIENYHTQQLGEDANAGTSKDSITFTLTVTNTTDVKFYAHWGTSSYYGYAGYPDNNNERYILDGEEVALSIIRAINNDTPSDNTEDKDETTPTDATTLPTTENKTPPAESTTPSEQTTPSESTGTSEPTTTTEPSSITEPSDPANTTEPAATELTDSTASTETQPTTETTETTGAPTTEPSE